VKHHHVKVEPRKCGTTGRMWDKWKEALHITQEQELKGVMATADAKSGQKCNFIKFP